MNCLLHSSAVHIIYRLSNLNSVVSKQQAQIIKEKAPTNMTAGIMARSQFHKENWCLLCGETTVKSFERQILRRRRRRFNQPRFSCRFVLLRRPTAASGIFLELKVPYCIFTSQLQYWLACYRGKLCPHHQSHLFAVMLTERSRPSISGLAKVPNGPAEHICRPLGYNATRLTQQTELDTTISRTSYLSRAGRFFVSILHEPLLLMVLSRIWIRPCGREDDAHPL